MNAGEKKLAEAAKCYEAAVNSTRRAADGTFRSVKADITKAEPDDLDAITEGLSAALAENRIAERHLLDTLNAVALASGFFEYQAQAK